MSMVVDTCVILDVLERDPTFGIASAEAIDRHVDGGLITRNATDFRALFPSLNIITP